jgi:hypothetical protein
MAASVPFSKQELCAGSFYPEFRGARLAKFLSPITPRENLRRLYAHENFLWSPRNRCEFGRVDLSINPDNVARGPAGGPDMFGVRWVFDPASNGSMVAPGSPILTDIEAWRSVIHIPDVDKWDWEGFAARENPKADPALFKRTVIMNGLFERLISFMDFGNAAIALVDEDQQPYVHELLCALCGMYEKIILRAKQYLDIDVLIFHDDWGTQRAPMFSTDTCREMLFPYIRRLAQFSHAHGVFFEQHSCGNVETFLPIMIEAGVDSWDGQENANDKADLIRRYGERLLIYICPPDTSGLEDTMLYPVAERFVGQFAPGARMLLSMNAENQRLDAALYALTRIGCAGAAE